MKLVKVRTYRKIGLDQLPNAARSILSPEDHRIHDLTFRQSEEDGCIEAYYHNQLLAFWNGNRWATDGQHFGYKPFPYLN